MMIIPSAAQTLLESDTPTIAFCIEIEKKDSSFLRLTSHSENVTVGGDVYHSDVGADATAIKLVNNMAVGGGEIATLVKSSFITQSDIFAGHYNGAAYKIFMVNFLLPNDWEVILSTGELGELRIEGELFTAELRSLAQRLNRTVGKYYQPGCRAQLFDAECTVNPTAYSYSGTVSAVASNETFTGSPTKAIDFFKYGRVLWLTGNNAGLVSEIKSNDGAGVVNLLVAVGSPIQVGDTYTIREGCNKIFETCKTKFSNGINFRGEPHIPGIDKAFIARI